MKWQCVSTPMALLAASVRKKLQNLPVLARNIRAIFILLVVDAVLISLTAVSMQCFYCCMALVNLPLLSIYLIYDPGAFAVHVRGPREEKHWVDPNFMEVNGIIFFHFHGVRTLPELLPKACGCQGPLGTNETYHP